MPNFSFPINPPSNHFKIPLLSLEEAREFASFPVKMPATLPSNWHLASFEHLWPPHIDAVGRQRKIHADWILATYRDAEGHAMQIIQGFIGLFYEWTTLNPPQANSGTADINGRNGVWITANPALGEYPRRVNGRRIIAAWEENSDFTYLGWQDGLHPAPLGGKGDSPRYYGLASDTLGLSDLAGIARSVPVTPFVA